MTHTSTSREDNNPTEERDLLLTHKEVVFAALDLCKLPNGGHRPLPLALSLMYNHMREKGRRREANLVLEVMSHITEVLKLVETEEIERRAVRK